MALYANSTTNYAFGYNQGEPGSSTSDERRFKTIDSLLEMWDRVHYTSGCVISEGTYTGTFVSGASTVTLTSLVAGIPYANRKLLVNVSTTKTWTGLTNSNTYWLYATVTVTSATQRYSTDYTAVSTDSDTEPTAPANSILLAKAVTTASGITVYSSEEDLAGTAKKWARDVGDPEDIDDYSVSVAEMRATTDPYPGATPSASQAVTLVGELERLRYQVLNIMYGAQGATPSYYWYQDPPTNLDSLTRPIHTVTLLQVPSEESLAAGTSLGGEFRLPYSGTVLDAGLYVDVAGLTGTMVADIHLNGVTIMETNKINLDSGRKLSEDSVTQPTLTTTNYYRFNVLTIDFDAVHTTAAQGCVVWLKIQERTY